MRKVVVVAFLLAVASPARAATIFLDFDTAATGANIITLPLVTSEGVITAVGAELVTFTTDPEFNAAGASGNKIDHLGALAALVFDFDVSAISFVYGGNSGDITVRVLNNANVVLDSFFQDSTGDGQPAGPITLSGLGIRRLEWSRLRVVLRA